MPDTTKLEYPVIEDLGEYTTDDNADYVPDPDVEIDTTLGADETDETPVTDDTNDTPDATPGADAPDADTENPYKLDAETPDDVSTFADKAAQYDAWADRWARDPVGFMKTFVSAMSPDQQAALMAGTQPQPEAAPEYEAQSPVEEHYLKNMKMVEQIPQFAQAVNQEFSVRDGFINDSLIRTSILEAQVSALMQMLDAALPVADRAAIEKSLATEKVNYTTAVEKHYRPALEKAVKISKQARKPRPSTPANQSGDAMEVPRGTKDMAQIYRMINGSR